MADSLNAIDYITIQEYLSSYGKLLDWLPVSNELEAEQKVDRLKTIRYLTDLIEVILEGDKNGK